MKKTWEEVTEEIAKLEKKDISPQTHTPLSVECRHKRITEPEPGIGSKCLDCGKIWDRNLAGEKD